MTTVLVIAGLLALGSTPDPVKGTLLVRGQAQKLLLYGTRGGPTVVVASSDGGWIHLSPYVAKLLASKGYFVVGFDCKQYLSSFTDGPRTLSEQDVPGDFRVVLDYAAQGGGGKPVLIGVSLGAGLAVLAATGAEVKERARGVIGLGLCDRNELGWRFRDSTIYITHKVPNEPTFSVAAVIDRVAPLPLAAIQSTHDDFAPLDVTKSMLARAREPSQLMIVDAQDHNFNGNLEVFNQRLLEALQWIDARAMNKP
jgi:fermentation-respiration switch protein FrsA (DUF1100 family)